MRCFSAVPVPKRTPAEGVERNFIVAFAGMCPYLKDARSCERTVCECARFTFPDKISRRDILYKYCGHPTNWKNCTFKSALDGYYERKYSEVTESASEKTVFGAAKEA